MARGPSVLALFAVLAAGAPALPAQGPPSGQPPALTVTQGPRGGTWKRTFNPFLNDADTRFPAAAGVYEPLLIHNRATGANTPWLATGFQWLADNSRLRFAIRRGVVWSDGTPFSARDVVFTFELMKRVPALDLNGVWSFLGGVAAPDPQTVEFAFRRPYTPGLILIGHQAIVPEHRWKAVAQPATFDDPEPVGTGPFTEVVRFEPTVYELGRNPRYWQPGKPAASRLRIPLYRSNDEIVRALNANELDWASLFLSGIEQAWVAKAPAHHQYWYPDFGPTVLLVLNTRSPPFDDRNVRKAISMALDRPRVMIEALGGYAPPADETGLAESQKRWKDAALAAGAGWTKRDVAKANRLLDAAGLARGPDGVRLRGGQPLRYDLHVVQGWSDWAAAARIMRENLAEVGVAASVKALAYGDWVEALRRGRFDLGMWFGTRGPTPYQFYRGQLDGALVRPVGEEASDNYHRFASAEAEALLRRFEVSSDPEELLGLNRQLQKLYVDEAPSLPLFASPLWGVFNLSRFTGFPNRFNPYAAAAPGGQPDALPVLLEAKPRQ